MEKKSSHTSQIEDLDKEEMFSEINIGIDDFDAPTVQIEDVRQSEAFAEIDTSESADDEDRPTVLLDDLNIKSSFADAKVDIDEDDVYKTADEDDDDDDDDEDDDRATVLLEDLSIQENFAEIDIAEDEVVLPIDTKKLKVPTPSIKLPATPESTPEPDSEVVVPISTKEMAPPLPTPPASMSELDKLNDDDMFSEIRLDNIPENSSEERPENVVNIFAQKPNEASPVNSGNHSLSDEIENDLRKSEIFSLKDLSTETVQVQSQHLHEKGLSELFDTSNSLPAQDNLTGLEQVRVQSTIRQLREERGNLFREIASLKQIKVLSDQELLGIRSELDEVKIESSFFKKRALQEIETAKAQIKVYEDKLTIAEDKNRKYKLELDKIGQRLKVDYNQVKHKEQELEGQLELLKMDAHAQIEVRDKKILELQRKIDTLEFSMENMILQDQRLREDKIKAEEKLNKIMLSLKTSVSQMEKDVD